MTALAPLRPQVGTIEPIEEIAAVIKGSGALFHSDAAQSIGKVSGLMRGQAQGSGPHRWRRTRAAAAPALPTGPCVRGGPSRRRLQPQRKRMLSWQQP